MGSFIRRFAAVLRYGTPLAADPVYRDALVREADAVRHHKSSRAFREAKTARLRSALEHGRVER